MVWVVWLSLRRAKKQTWPIQFENMRIGQSLLNRIGRPIIEASQVPSKLVPELTISNLSGAGPGQISEIKSRWIWNWGELVLGPRTIRLMKLMASTMLSAAIKRQYSSVFRYCQFLTNLWSGSELCIFTVRVTLIHSLTCQLCQFYL